MTKGLHLRYFARKDDKIPYDSHFLFWSTSENSLKESRISEMVQVVIDFMALYPDGRVEYVYLD
jgi:hypothetical protein